MATVTFLVPEHDADKARELATEEHDLAGVQHIEVQHKPFDPRGPDADSQPFEEYWVIVTYDSAQTSAKQLHDLVRARNIHFLDMIEET